jgi:hypothetical protein
MYQAVIDVERDRSYGPPQTFFATVIKGPMEALGYTFAHSSRQQAIAEVQDHLRTYGIGVLDTQIVGFE